MKPKPWERAKELFSEALELPEQERGRFLDAQCAGDGNMRLRVERLLDAHGAPSGPLQDSDPALKALTGEPSAPRTFQPGDDAAGRFRIRRFLGRGGMGEVYEAEDLDLGGVVALKTLRPEYVADDRLISRFRREVQIARRVTHPNVCRVFDAGKHSSEQGGEVAFLTMELLEGETLAERLKRVGRLTPEEALPIIRQMADGLDALHQEEIVHRDFKPSNVMLIRSATGEERAVITDFGLARKLSSETGIDTAVSNTGQILGTPDYMAPEQLTGKPVTPATDVYALGLVLYEMLTGEKPFPEGQPIEKAVQRITERPTAPKAKVPELPRTWSKITSACLAKEPEDRPSDVLGIAEMLEGASPTPIPARRSSKSRRALGSVRRRSRRARYAAIGAGILALVALSGYLSRDTSQGSEHPLASESIHIAVLPFTVAGADGDIRDFAYELTGMMSMRLTQFEAGNSVFSVVPASEVRSQSISSPGEARGKLGATHVIEGSLQRRSEAVRLMLVLTDAAELRQLDMFELRSTEEDVVKLADAAITKLGASLDLAIRPDRVGSVARTEPGAYEFYLQGRGYMERTYATENIDTAIGLFQRALDVDPDYGLAHAGMAQALWRRYELEKDPALAEKALVLALRAVKLAPQEPHTHITLGEVYVGTGRHRDAVAEYQDALEIDDRNGGAFMGLASAYAGLGEDDKAESTYRRAIALRPADWTTYKELGLFYGRRQRYRDAIEQYRKVIELTPDNAHGWANLGTFCYLDGDRAAAERHWTRAAEIDPDRDSVHNNLGRLHFEDRRYGEAARSFQLAIEGDPNNHLYWGNLGAAQLWLPDSRASVASYGRALALADAANDTNPSDERIISHMALYAAAALQSERAVELVAAAERQSLDKRGRLRLASALMHLGRESEAHDWVDKARAAGALEVEIRSNPQFGPLLANE